MTVSQDLRYALRAARRAPAFTATVVGLVALGIGANTTVFTAVNGILLRPLPYREPGRLVVVRENGSVETSRNMRVGVPDFIDWRDQSTSFSDVAAYAPTSFNVGVEGRTERARAQIVSHNLAQMLGVRLALGVFFSPEHDRPGNGRVAVVSHAFWQRAFNARPDVVGRAISLNADPYTIVGVMPPEFVAPEPADVWIPMGYLTGAMLQWRANHALDVVGRLRDGISLQRAHAELNAVAQRGWASDRFMREGWTVEVTTLVDVIRGPTRPALVTMLAAVIAVLLVVCANVASLLLARGASRRQELAIRLALGASPGRVARQLMTESGVLALAGATLGVMVAYAATGVIGRAVANQIPHFASLRTDGVVLLYAFAMTVGAVLLFTAAPVLEVFRGSLALRRARGGASDPGRRVLTRLVTGEVAVSVTLLVLAVMLVSSFQRVMRADPGFTPERVLTFRLTLPSATYATPAQRLSALDRVRQRLAELPDVRAVGLASSLPFSALGERRGNSLFVMSHHGDERTRTLRTDIDLNHVPTADVRYVDAGFFSALGVRLVRGVTFSAYADAASEPVAVISETTARRVFPGEDPIGQRIAVGSDPGTWRTIVGVTEDVANRGLRETPVEEVYLSQQHLALSTVAFAMRTRQDPGALAQAVTREIGAVLPDVPVYDVQTMTDRLADSVGVQRIAALVMRGLSLVAFVLAVTGLYGVLAYLVARRTHEFGVRMALGARQVDVVGLLLGQAMRVVAVGVGIGLATGAVASQLIARRLDLAAMGGVAAIVAIIGAVAAGVPAYRASRTDPMVALRSE
ncbi:MAG TPA: ABC transporter permease [Gemmatimonadaceae bacterium]|nr:ABC transporter permease [Gemmatimonadaceae bacterium]